MEAGNQAEKGMHKEFMAMLLRAYDSKGRNVFSSSSSDAGTVDFSDGFGGLGGVGSNSSSVSGGGTHTSGLHRRSMPYLRDGLFQPGSGGRHQRVVATTPVRRHERISGKYSQSGTAADADLQQEAEDDTLLSWAAQHSGATGLDSVARQNAEKSRAAVRPD